MNLKNVFYQDENGNDKYNSQCINCSYDCKQSFRAIVVNCRLLKEIKSKNGKRK
jgi:hypothetical protein